MRNFESYGIQAVTALIAVALFGGVIIAVVNGWARRTDFSALYTAGYMVAHGDGRRLYDLREQQVVEAELLRRPGFLRIIHPPFEAVLLAPLSWLPYEQAYAVWGALNTFVWLFWACLVRPHVPVPERNLEYLLLCVSFLPAWVALLEGQTSLVLLLLFTLTFVSLKQNKQFRAGAFLALGLFRFQLILPFALICLLRREWRMIRGFTVVALGLGVLSIAAVGPSGVADYSTLLSHMALHAADPVYAVIVQSMPCVRGFFAITMSTHFSAIWIGATIAAFSAFLILFAAWWWKRQDQRLGLASLSQTFSVAVLVCMMTAFHFYIYDLTIALLPLLLIIGHSHRQSSWSRCNVIAAILFFPGTYVLLLASDRMYMLFPVLVAFFLAAVLLRSTPLSGSVGGDRC